MDAKLQKGCCWGDVYWSLLWILHEPMTSNKHHELNMIGASKFCLFHKKTISGTCFQHLTQSKKMASREKIWDFFCFSVEVCLPTKGLCTLCFHFQTSILMFLTKSQKMPKMIVFIMYSNV